MWIEVARSASCLLSRLERFVWPLIGTKLLANVRPVDVLRIIDPLTLTPNTAEGVRVIVQQIYNHPIQKLIVEVNPALPHTRRLPGP